MKFSSPRTAFVSQVISLFSCLFVKRLKRFCSIAKNRILFKIFLDLAPRWSVQARDNSLGYPVDPMISFVREDYVGSTREVHDPILYQIGRGLAISNLVPVDLD